MKNFTVEEINLMPAASSGLAANGKVYSGDYLMKAGISLTIGNTYESTVLLITEQ